DLATPGTLDAAEIDRRLDAAEHLFTEVPEEEHPQFRQRMQTIRSAAALGTQAHEVIAAIPEGFQLSGPWLANLVRANGVLAAAGALSAQVRDRFEKTIRRAMVDHGDAVLANYPKLSPTVQTWATPLQVNNLRENGLTLLAGRARNKRGAETSA